MVRETPEVPADHLRGYVEDLVGAGVDLHETPDPVVIGRRAHDGPALAEETPLLLAVRLEVAAHEPGVEDHVGVPVVAADEAEARSGPDGGSVVVLHLDGKDRRDLPPADLFQDLDGEVLHHLLAQSELPEDSEGNLIRCEIKWLHIDKRLVVSTAS